MNLPTHLLRILPALYGLIQLSGFPTARPGLADKKQSGLSIFFPPENPVTPSVKTNLEIMPKISAKDCGNIGAGNYRLEG
ncbi:MAG: hypothetical protein M3Y54_20480 [Bacteroidota bacterium]|nr:hypothetical protein [Bacteroidota bacterium]